MEKGYLSFTWYQPHISGCRVWKTLLSYLHDTSPTSAAALCRGLRSLTHSRWHGAPASVAHPLASSKAAPANESYYETAHKCEESPDAQKSARRRGVTWCPCAEKRANARSHLVPLRGKSARRQGVTWCPCAEKRAKAISHLMPRRAPYQPSRFRWTITSVVHAPTKWCSTRSYSIVTVRSDRCWCMSAQRSGAAHSRLPPSPVKKQQTVRSRSSLAHGSSQGHSDPLLPRAGCAGKSVKKPGKSPQAVSLFKFFRPTSERYRATAHVGYSCPALASASNDQAAKAAMSVLERVGKLFRESHAGYSAW